MVGELHGWSGESAKVVATANDPSDNTRMAEVMHRVAAKLKTCIPSTGMAADGTLR
jgi:hypothetical protein